MESNFFPVFIDLTDKKILVVGGGKIALRRVNTILKFNAKVTVIAPELIEELKVLKEKNLIEVIDRNYISQDIKGSFIVVAATDNRQVNYDVGVEAKAIGAFVTVADCKAESNFYFPAVFEDEGIIGGLISKGGKDHSLVKTRAAEIRKWLLKGEKNKYAKED